MFRRKKKVVRERTAIKHIPLPVLIRQVIYDSMLMPAEEIAVAMGLPPISDEVAEMEEAASEERLEKFSFLIPFIDSHADIASKIAISAYMIEEDDMEGVEKYGIEDLENLGKMFRLVALSSSISCISTLFNMGLIESRMSNE